MDIHVGQRHSNLKASSICFSLWSLLSDSLMTLARSLQGQGVRRCIDTLDQQVVGPGRFSVERMPLEEWKGIVAEARAEASLGTKSELLAQIRQGLGSGEPQIIRVEQTPKLTAFTGGGGVR